LASWFFAAWAFYFFARLPISLVRFPAPANLPPDAASMHLSFLLVGTAFFVVTAAVLSISAATILVVPYAFMVIAPHPERRFWGEHAPMVRVLLWLAVVFVPLGLLFGAFSPPLQTTLTVGDSEPTARNHPSPAPSRGGSHTP
jgi:hypothetical protein